MAFIDSGFGGPIVDRLRQVGYRNVIEVSFGSSPPDNRHFLNMLAWMWGKVKDWLAFGAIAIDELLDTDLTGPGYYHDKSDRLVLESKRTWSAAAATSPAKKPVYQPPAKWRPQLDEVSLGTRSTLIGPADDRRDHAGRRQLRLDPRRESRRPEESLLEAVRERLAVLSPAFPDTITLCSRLVDDRTDDRAFGADDVAPSARSSENYVFR